MPSAPELPCSCRTKCGGGKLVNKKTYLAHENLRKYDAENPGWWTQSSATDTARQQGEDAACFNSNGASFEQADSPLPSQLHTDEQHEPQLESCASSPTFSETFSWHSSRQGNDDSGHTGLLDDLDHRDEVEYMSVHDLPHPSLPHLQMTMNCIELLQNATHEHSGYPPGLLDQIYEPLNEAFGYEDPDVRLCLDVFIHTQNASRESYTLICAAIKRHNPAFKPVSWDKMNRNLASWTGIHLMRFDMCPRGCMGYTGDFSDVEYCLECAEPRYDPLGLEQNKKIPRKQFFVMPPAPQFQARWSHPERASDMKYGWHKMKDNIKLRNTSPDHHLPEHNDIFTGASILRHFEEGNIMEHDTMILYSCDGAQLYASRASDCWFGTMVILNLPPEKRYKQDQVCPVLIIPGPNKPKNMDSFNFPVFYQCSALMQHGFHISDGVSVESEPKNRIFNSNLHLMLAGADGPGMTTLSGGVGHSGAAGCRVHCPFKGRRKKGGSHYYPVLQLPHPYNVQSCSHPDSDAHEIAAHQPSLQVYLKQLSEVLAASTKTGYNQARLKHGISKPSILLGLPLNRMIGIPHVFCLDMMHVPALNAPELLIPLFRGIFERDTQDKDDWPWSESLGNKDIWEEHGALVEKIRRWIPIWYGQSPRNPALKINTDYKAWEFLIYLYGLGPMIFRTHLPVDYWVHYCELVRIIELSGQTEITHTQLVEINRLSSQWQWKYEELYVMRKSERLHFVRPWIHLLLHLSNEIFLKGPPAFYAQWTMERVIGYLKEGLRLHSNPYANMAWVATRLCQINAMKSIVPDIVIKKLTVYDTGNNLGNGFALLHPREDRASKVPGPEAAAIDQFLTEYGLDPDPLWLCNRKIVRFARAALPNGSVVRCSWKENLRDPDSTLVARHAELIYQSDLRYAEIRYFCYLPVKTASSMAVAVVTLFSHPLEDWLTLSSQTYRLCTKGTDADLAIILVKNITTLIAMIPDESQASLGDMWCAVYRPGANISRIIDEDPEDCEETSH